MSTCRSCGAEIIWAITEAGKRIPLEVKKGDKVIYSKYAGTELKQDNEELLILRESDILAKDS